SSEMPEYVFLVYQMCFAVITPALITGAFTNRVRFAPYLIFLVLWLTCVYFPAVHSIWGGGFLQEWGVLDFAGGIVVHATAGMAALASVFYVGKRHVVDQPHSIPLIAIGTGLLWFGWYGFNAGSALTAGESAALAFVNTDIAASFAGVTWLIIAWIHTGKPTLVGLLTGMVAGLATITPGAGYVDTWAAPIIGIVAGLLCYGAVTLKEKFGLDDALDVVGVHGVGGIFGVIMLGLFGRADLGGSDGLFFGGGEFFGKQVAAVVGFSLYAFVFTFVALWLINFITPVKCTEKDEEDGVDTVMFGECAYNDACGEILPSKTCPEKCPEEKEMKPVKKGWFGKKKGEESV
ncbi:ammonium transporter, partial [Aduncisulcus paluster]